MSEKLNAQAQEDAVYMERALELARQGRSWVAPNPLVGAVIVRNGAVLGEGFHERYGGRHAEANAVRDARERGNADLQGATLYVTLEPCSHHGKTPPCADLVIQCGISRVVYGMKDPNPLVAGRGLKRLQAAGIQAEAISAESGLERACGFLNRAFIKHITTGHPFITLKTALSLDGKTATASGESRWISCEESRADVHRLRAESAAILCGIGTVLADNPSLTVRIGETGEGGLPQTLYSSAAPDSMSETAQSSPYHTRSPVRVVADTWFRIPVDCTLVQTAREVPTWVAISEKLFAETLQQREALLKRASLEAQGVTIIPLPVVHRPDHGKPELHKAAAHETLDLKALSAELGRRGINSVLLEGGAGMAAGALEAGIVDRIRYYLAPTLIGGTEAFGAIGGEGFGPLEAAWRLDDISMNFLDRDIVVDARVDYSGRRSCLPE